MSKIPEFRVWYDNKMWCLAKLDLWGDPDRAICDLAPYLPKHEELYDIYLSDVILMQSTGLKDKHGFEIYEGDIVRYIFGCEYEVVFKDCAFGWMEDGFIPFTNMAKSEFAKFEVIGNIYENSDLLEG